MITRATTRREKVQQYWVDKGGGRHCVRERVSGSFDEQDVGGEVQLRVTQSDRIITTGAQLSV